jgi:hypothetical protein
VADLGPFLDPIRGKAGKPTSVKCSPGNDVGITAQQTRQDSVGLAEQQSASFDAVQCIPKLGESEQRERRRNEVNIGPLRQPFPQAINPSICPAISDEPHFS